jgi:hypothetical protein
MIDTPGGARLTVIETSATGPANVAETIPESQRQLREQLRALGPDDLTLASGGYRVVRADDSAAMPRRELYEAVNQQEARRVLAELAADTRLTPRQREVLQELLDHLAPAVKERGLEIVLLRRLRLYVTSAEQAEPVTPSQVRKQRKKPITLRLVDEWGNPKGDVGYKLETASDGTQTGSFPQSGEKVHAELDPGSVQLEMGVHPDDWFVRGAPPLGWLAQELAVSLKEAYGYPFANRKFEARFQDGTTLQGTTDAAGSASLQGTPSYPVSLVFADFDAEDYNN